MQQLVSRKHIFIEQRENWGHVVVHQLGLRIELWSERLQITMCHCQRGKVVRHGLFIFTK